MHIVCQFLFRQLALGGGREDDKGLGSFRVAKRNSNNTNICDGGVSLNDAFELGRSNLQALVFDQFLIKLACLSKPRL